MRNLAIIPARGDRKRPPRKNIKEFLGKPIICYPIEEAINSKIFDEIMVSTDDLEIAKIAKVFGASIPFMRSGTNANDFATTVDVLLEVINKYEIQGQEFDNICCIYPTAPFVSSKLLQMAFDKLITHQFDSVFPVLPFNFPIQRAVKIAEDRVKMIHPEHLNTRSQDLEVAYHDSGQFYWMKTEVLKSLKKVWTDNTGTIVLKEMQAHDIDNIDDWEIAEFKFSMNQKLKNTKTYVNNIDAIKLSKN